MKSLTEGIYLDFEKQVQISSEVQNWGTSAPPTPPKKHFPAMFRLIW